MPACKVGCCPDDVCNCSNDCECLLSSDADLSPGVGFENPFLIAEHNLKDLPIGTRLKICPCRTKEELTDYVKPIEARLHGDVGGGNDDDLNSLKKQDVSKNTNPDKCSETSVERQSSKGDHTGTHASHGHKDKSCDDVTGTKTADKDRGITHSKTNPSSRTCEGSTPNVETHKDSHTAAPYSEDKSCEGESPDKETHKHPQYCDDKGCSKNLEKASKSCYSLPTSNATANPNSPTRIAKAGNFEMKSNFSLDVNLSPMPYRKMRRSRSLAEARLGSLLNERRPSCFQLSYQELRDGVVPDPHRGHHHHYAHEYHHANGCRHHHHGKHDHHHGNHDHHDGNHDHHHGNHDHHHGNHDDHHDHNHHDDDYSHRHGNDPTDRNSFCEDPSCGSQWPSSIEELKLLMKSEGSKIDVGEMVVRTTKLRVQNLCCPKEGQIVQDELRKLEVCLLNFIFSLSFVMGRRRSVKFRGQHSCSPIHMPYKQSISE